MNRFDHRTGAARLALACVFATLTSSILVGCGASGPAKGSVSGKVTYKGQPVPKGTVTFVAVDAKGRNATGAINPDGSFTLQTENPGDGAILGDYKVTISARDDVVLDYTPTKPVPPKMLAPAKYESPESSGLTATVKSGSNTFNWELTD